MCLNNGLIYAEIAQNILHRLHYAIIKHGKNEFKNRITPSKLKIKQFYFLQGVRINAQRIFLTFCR